MEDPTTRVQAAHEFLDEIDWELVEDAAQMGAAGISFVRRHPWVLVAAGMAITAYGAIAMWRDRDHADHAPRRLRRRDATSEAEDAFDVMAP